MNLKYRLNSAYLRRKYGIPPIALGDIAAGLDDLKLNLSGWNKDLGAGGLLHSVTLATVTRSVRPRACFEIGTGDGRGASLFSANSPEGAVVHTLDPDYPKNPVKGSVFRGQPEEQKIRQYTGFSESFDFSEFGGQIDLVYIDGGHEYEDVIRDSRIAWDLLTPTGVILWDDVSTAFPGVMKALREWGAPKGACLIGGTDIAYLRRPSKS